MFARNLVLDAQLLAFTGHDPLFSVVVELAERVPIFVGRIFEPAVFLFEFDDGLSGCELMDRLTLANVADRNGEVQGSLLGGRTK